MRSCDQRNYNVDCWNVASDDLQSFQLNKLQMAIYPKRRHRLTYLGFMVMKTPHCMLSLMSRPSNINLGAIWSLATVIYTKI